MRRKKEWKELTSPRSFRESTSTALWREWQPRTAEKCSHAAAQRAEKDWLIDLDVRIQKKVRRKSNRDFSYLFKKGESVVTYGFVCYIKPRRAGKNRLGIVTGKKVGNAVKRNRARRIIREAFRVIDPMIRESVTGRFDFVFVARSKTPSLKTGQVLSLMKKTVLPKILQE